jgi:hypothetical protein
LRSLPLYRSIISEMSNRRFVPDNFLARFFALRHLPPSLTFTFISFDMADPLALGNQTPFP